ncbi:MAG: hypothetical protein DLM68_09530 [Hyphomicrobiales bacterium]|nr:MAG: hypothetical protein DLM68_09530 [Hyphomicrobiales bacterium]
MRLARKPCSHALALRLDHDGGFHRRPSGTSLPPFGGVDAGDGSVSMRPRSPSAERCWPIMLAATPRAFRPTAKSSASSRGEA